MVEHKITKEQMQHVYDAMKTPIKYGPVLFEEGANIDCPNIFRRPDGTFAMAYAKHVPGAEREGYETWLATSNDLLHWTPVGKLLAHTESGWDCLQADGSICLLDTDWDGDHSVHTWDNKYWMTYIGGCLPGYEPDPLKMGIAWSDTLTPGSFTRLPDPILTNTDSDVRPFETTTLYKSNVIFDSDESLGWPFVMFYNAKAGRFGIEKIGMAVSHDMIHWKRFGENCVVENEIEDRWNIAGDPQVIRFEDLWVMHYFVARDGMAYDTFACSKDLVHWTKWDGEPLIKPTKDYDKLFAHKPYVLQHNGTVYHFYCAVGDKGRGIALATSR